MGKGQWLGAFDRAASDALLEFMRSAAGCSLIRRVRSRTQQPVLYDLQLRSERPKSTRSWASVYFGLTTILNIVEHKGLFEAA